jgi:hypothetical protein
MQYEQPENYMALAQDLNIKQWRRIAKLGFIMDSQK